jgi:hypothetical protein
VLLRNHTQRQKLKHENAVAKIDNKVPTSVKPFVHIKMVTPPVFHGEHTVYAGLNRGLLYVMSMTSPFGQIDMLYEIIAELS